MLLFSTNFHIYIWHLRKIASIAIHTNEKCKISSNQIN